MHVFTVGSDPSRTRPELDPNPYNIALIYDDLEVGKRGKEICDRLLRVDPSESHNRIRVWSRPLINTHAGYRVAVDLAKEVSVVVLALRSSTPLSEGFKSWLTECLTQDTHSISLVVASFDVSSDQPHAAAPQLAWLEELTLKSNVTLIAHLPNREQTAR